jgi:hypothetical protein
MNAPPYGPPQRSFSPPRAHDFHLNGMFATVAVAADTMTGAIEFASLFALFAFSLFVAAVLFVAGVIIQRKAGDPLSLAFAKALCVALLMAIPTPFPGFLIAAWGVGSAMKGHSRPSHDADTIDMN